MKIFDIYGTEFKFLFHGENTYRTTFGFICTLLSFIIAIVVTVTMGSDFFFKTNPRIISGMGAESQKIKISEIREIFKFSFGIPDNYTSYILPNFIKSKVQYFKISSKEKISFEISLKPELLHGMDVWGLDLKNNTNFEIFYQDFYNFASVTIDLYYIPCSEIVKSNCIFHEEWKRFAKNYAVFYSYADYIFNTNSLNHPLQLSETYGALYLYSSGIATINQIMFKNIQLEDDQGWISKNIKQMSIITMEKVSTDFYEMDEIEFGVPIMAIELAGINRYSFYKRSFMKLQELWVYIRSILSPTIFLFKTMLQKFNQKAIRGYIFQIFESKGINK
jgi:hypothetical protein